MADLVIRASKVRLDHMHRQLGYLRCWIQGFEAGGKSGPHGADVLRQVQLLIAEAKEEDPPDSPLPGQGEKGER